MKLSKKLAQTPAVDAGIAYFVPKKAAGSLYATAFAEMVDNPQLFQILENFEFTHGLPVFTEGTTEKILEARIYRYLVLSSGWDSAIAPDELTHAATWEALAAA
jgi:hypothetical protein